MDAQLKKGILEMCILFSVSKEEMYGYDIMNHMHQYFPDVNESTFYAILRRLNKEGRTETYLGERSNGPTRKYYRITNVGKKTLEESIGDFKHLCGIVEDLGINIDRM